MAAIDKIKKFTEKAITLAGFTYTPPVMERVAKSNQEIIDTERQRVGLIDVLKGIPESTKKVAKAINKFGQTYSGAGLARMIIQETARSGGAVGLTLATPFIGTREIRSEDLTPFQRAFKEVIFGPDAVKSIQTRIAEAEVRVKRFGEEKEIEFIERQALPLAAIGVVAVVGLDFTGAGGKKQVVKTLAKVNKVDDVAKILKTINVADDLIPAYSKVIAGMNKVDDVARAIDKITDIQKTTKAVPKGFKFRERQFLSSVRDAVPDVPLKVGGQYVPRSTDRLAIRAKNLILDNIDEAERVARTGTDDKAIATASELIKHYSDEAAKTTSKAIKDALYEKASDLSHLTARNLTEQGRSVQAASIMGRLTPEGQLRFAAKEINRYNEAIEKSRGLLGLKKKIPQLTPEQSKMILSEFKRIEAMPDGVKKAMAFKQLSNSIADLIPTGMYQKIIAVWKAGLLTGVKTSGVNTFSNLTHGFTETVKDIPAAAVDNVASLFTKKRTLALTTKSKGGVKEGFQKGWRYLATGYDERNVGAKLDYKRVNFGKSKAAKAIQTYEETVFHLMGAEDQPFYYGAKAKSLYSQAIAQAKNKKIPRGAARIKFVDDLVASPTDEMLKYATMDAEIAVFQNPTTLGNIAKGIQKLGGGAGEIVVPFGRTPAAVANQLINYSPVGIVKTIAQNIGKGKFDQRLFSQGIGRGITGTAIMYLGTLLYKQDMVSLNYPETERERELWKAEGRKSNSILIAGKWRGVAVLGPGGFALLTGGYFQRGLEDSGSISKGLSEATLGGAASLKEQTFLQGIQQLSDAIDDPERYSQGYFSGLVSSVIPTLFGDVAKSYDPLERRTSEEFLGRAKAKILGLRQTLEPQISVLGEERGKGGNWLETMIDPSRPSKAIDSPVANELRRLKNAGYEVSPTLVGDRQGYEGLTPEENTAMWMKVGEVMNSKLTNLFDSEQYKNLPDADKAEIVEDFVRMSKLYGRALVVADLTEGLSGQELKDKFSELKEGGLMTLEVFRTFLKL